eukprot:GFUD01017415.1.p1 GENE.GFUD01017415.1~~GFUD01017415.1.p1  ORF type:complete len:352 (+),score=105.88 GFUD01017415.1:52-1107(+)
MTEVWKSNENKFCKYCKCWVADNKVSWAGHEQGVRHKKAVEEKLSEMKRKAVSDMKSAKDEAHWLKQMEVAALRDYKSKDIVSNRDFTAKLYNNEDLPDVNVTYEAGPSNEPTGAIGPKIPSKMKDKKKKVDPMMEPTGTAPDKWDKDYEMKIMDLNPVVAPSSGTKWHKPSTPKFWYEAKNDEGASYYWHVTTQESRWDKPKGGFVSVAEQKALTAKASDKVAKKARVVQENKYFHGEHNSDVMRAMPDMNKKDPYGGGGWSRVEEREEEQPVDLGLPQRREKMQPVIDKAEVRHVVYKEKTVSSVQANNSFGLVPDSDSSSSSSVGISKPVINFRKRKNHSVRERGDDD